MHLALIDKAFFTGMDKLDGILDGQDMAVFGLVDVIDHGR